MYLKRLTVQGFKSFGTRTTFDFGTGVTAVVGPNGSGKSNVADAIRWVLGEQSTRLLRAKKNEDVIFSGTTDKSAVGMAEALLTLDNSDRWLPLDFAEVEIGRRLYRNGESEYLVNGQRVRLRDVLDLLMRADVGQNSYTIMGQGLVDEVLLMSPEERRVLLDEAADVKRFRMKIREAQDRLGATRENMARVEMVIAEIEPRLTNLGRQAERAAEHRRLSHELAGLVRAYYGQRWSEEHNTLVRSRATLDQKNAEHLAASERVDTLREQIRTLGDEIRKRREALARRDERSIELEHKLRANEQAMQFEDERLAMADRRRTELAAEIATLEGELTHLEGAQVDGSTSEIAEQAAAVNAEVARQRQLLEEAEREYGDLRGQLQQLQASVAEDDRRQAAIVRDADGAAIELVRLEQEVERAQARRKQLLVELIGYGRRFAELRLQPGAGVGLDGARQEAEDARTRMQRVQQEVRSYEESASADLRSLDQLDGRFDALQRVQAEHEGVTTGTRNVLLMGQALIEGVEHGTLGEPAELNGIVGLLSRALRVPAGLENAVNAALEQRLHAVVVTSEQDALQAIDVLRHRGLGRAQFLPIDTVRHVYPLNLNREKGVVGVAAKVVRCDQRFRTLVDTLLGRVIIVEDVPTGMRMVRRGLGSVVTLDGTYIEPSGIISGGSATDDAGVFHRQRELDELPARIEELRERTSTNSQRLEQARVAVSQVQQQVDAAENRYQELRRHYDENRHALERERERLHKIRREMDAVRARLENIARDRQARERLIEQSRLAAEQIVAKGAERTAELAGLETAVRDAARKRELALTATTEASSRLAALEGERKARLAMHEQHTHSLERVAGGLVQRREQLQQIESEAGAASQRRAALETGRAALLEQKSTTPEEAAPDRDELHRLENHERQVQDDLQAAHDALLAVERNRIELEANVARTLERIETLAIEMEREGLAPNRAGHVVPIEKAAGETTPLFEEGTRVHGAAALDLDATRRRIEEIRRQVRRLGPINEEAPEDYKESKQRHEFLTAQMRDLAEAEGQLRAAIAELNGEIRSRFSATFAKVDTAFGEYFAAFFGGGEAKLSLTGDGDVVEAGIEIEAQPPGKRLRSLSLLSGGERSLTAVALLFALLTVNPAPFVVLDEVDAALDEANVGRFITSLGALSERTQFLIVTHNRKTVEVADAIYGVSMAKGGVSKVLSLRLADLPRN